MVVTFKNEALVYTPFTIRWRKDGREGETIETTLLACGQGQRMSMINLGIPDGASCWACAHVHGGPNHESRDNFDYHQNAPNVTYTLTGTVTNTSFDFSQD